MTLLRYPCLAGTPHTPAEVSVRCETIRAMPTNVPPAVFLTPVLSDGIPPIALPAECADGACCPSCLAVGCFWANLAWPPPEAEPAP